MSIVTIDGGPLTFSDVINVAHGGAEVRLDSAVPGRMAPARAVVQQAVAEYVERRLATL